MAGTPTVSFETRDGVEVVTLRTAENVYAEVAPALGNNCFAFVAGDAVLEEVAFNEFARKPTSYGIPNLFPFPNRIRDGRFRFRGEEFVVDPPRHGMVRDKAWRVVDSGASAADGAWVRCRFDAADAGDRVLAQFPFPFGIEVTYRLADRTLTMLTTVENTGDRDMPYGFGIHPYFRRPANGLLSVPAGERWELEESLPTGRRVPADGELDLRHGADLASLTLDDVYTALDAGPEGLAQCTIVDSSTGATTRIEFDAEEFPHVVAYTAPAPREAICVEPQTCPTDAFNLAERGIPADVRVLAPGGRDTLEIRFSA
jgi:aldose 1-epimerase